MFQMNPRDWMLFDWNRPSRESRRSPFGCGALGAAVQAGIETDAGAAMVSPFAAPVAVPAEVIFRRASALPEPEPGDRKKATGEVSRTIGEDKFVGKFVKHLITMPPADRLGTLSMLSAAPVTLAPKSFAVMNQRRELAPAWG